MRIALVDANKVVNIIAADDLGLVPSSYVAVPLEESEPCEIGQSYDEAANPRFFGDVPRPPQAWTAYEFLLRFTAAERAAFRAAAATDAQVADFQQLAQAAQEIRSDDPMTLAGMDYLVSVALLSSERRAEILGL